jgi:hypothetical protein
MLEVRGMRKTEHRRAAENARYYRTDAVTGRQVKLVADDLGVITITSAEERRVADAFGLPVTRIPKLSGDEVAELRKEQSTDGRR